MRSGWRDSGQNGAFAAVGFRGSNKELCVPQTEECEGLRKLEYNEELQIVFHIELTEGLLSNLALLSILRASP